MYYHDKRRPKKRNSVLFYFMLFLIGGIGFWVYHSNIIERTPPTIKIEKNIFWNLETPIKINISDNTGIKSCKVSLVSGDQNIHLLSKKINAKKNIDLNITFPSKTFFPASGNPKLVVEVTDKSLWNFTGNKSISTSNITIDRKRPKVNILARSSIALGGTGLVIFFADDKNLKDLKIITNHKQTFKVTRFIKDKYYIALVPRGITTRGFRAYIQATDKANNTMKRPIAFFNKNIKYRNSKIRLSKRFLDGKIMQLHADYFNAIEENETIRFIRINENLRKKSFELITKHTSDVKEDLIKSFNINAFEPLKNYSKVASFGDHRYFYMKKKLISQSYHLGIDLANIKNGDVFSSNNGRVVFASSNGIYGKMPIVYYGLGLYGVYGHCSRLLVQEGEQVKAGEEIAKTGVSGLALGDHLHFELRVQGVPVRPIEWMDEKWIKLNITDKIEKVRKIIEERSE